MEKLKIEYNIPESKKDITLEQWIAFEKIASVKDADEEFLNKKMLQIFCNVPLKYTLLMKQSEITEMTENLTNVFSTKSGMITKFDFEGVEYGLIPNFDNNITQGELIDLDNYLEKKDWVRLLSILYRPIVKNVSGLYQIEPYSATHLKFSQLSYEVFDGILTFFLTGYQQLTKCILKHTQKQVKMMKDPNSICLTKVNSLLNGVDIQKLFGS